jgi:nicotinate-nucleotide adenylyltransferase
MHIGLYFGSFNPIHTGHLIIANHIAQNTLVQQVWLVVSPQNPLKTSSSLLNEYNRLHLVQLATQNNTLLKASDIEFKLPKPSYTIDTLIYLQEKYPQHQFSIIMGSDSFQNIHRWKNAPILLKEWNIIVYERPQFVIDREKLPHNISVANAPLLDISSTYIRKQIHDKKSITYLVPAIVEDEIVKAGYYSV